ncbi:MAG: glycerol-3-phosphate dehydrogenase [Thalassobius sp.]|nr:glycerol-3-phosphate dehydrogenase [Thalassovita sp.]
MEKSWYNISIIGAGKLAWHLAQALTDAEIKINQVYSRSEASATKLVQRINQGSATIEKDFSFSSSNIFFIALPDDVVPTVLNEFHFPESALLMHTSGTLPISVLESVGKQIGVFYPLQTFSFGKNVDFKKIPICLETSDENCLKQASFLAGLLSNEVHLISSEKRKSLHLAAVFACNFSNRLFALSEDILKKEEIPFHLLSNLVNETVVKAFEIGPEKSQTGPAIRNDIKTIEAHTQLLNGDSEKLEIYKLLTNSIRGIK